MDIKIRERQAYRAQITRIQTAVNKHPTTPLSENSVKVHLEKLNELKISVTDIQKQIQALCADDKETTDQAAAFEWYDDMLSDLKIALLDIKDEFPVVTSHKPTPHSTSSSVKLPRIELPTFDGKYENWTPFEDLFKATVENNASLSDAQKLQYLKTAVKGEAASLIKAYQITNSNYKEAWTQLSSRYSNEREIIHTIIKRLFSQPAVTKESSTALLQLLDTTTECTRALEVLKRPVDQWDDILVFMVVERFDSKSKEQWAMTLKGTSYPSFKEVSEFMEQRVRALQAGGKSEAAAASGSGIGNRDRKQVSAHHVSSSCPSCKDPHQIFKCEKFLSMSPTDRGNLVKTLNLCFNCLRPGHSSRDCPSKFKCRECSRRHNTLLHLEQKKSAAPILAGSCSTDGDESIEVLLATAIVIVQDHGGVERKCRVLLDGGSQASFITESCVKSLGLKREKCDVTVSGISATSVGTARGVVNITLKSALEHRASIEVEALILSRVTGTLPRIRCEPTAWPHLKGLPLADSTYNQPGKVDILLGADVVGSIMREGRREGKKNSPIAQNSIFGWVLSGKVTLGKQQLVQVHHGMCEAESILKRFWELEELPATRHFTHEEKVCEDHFVDTHTRNTSGRYVVKFPFRENITSLGDSRVQAVSRLKQVERRLARNPEHKKQYVEFMREYQNLQHMVRVSPPLQNQVTYYLPHHFVLKQESTSTKFRVVFDGSAKSTSGVSLNNCLMVGPTIQDDLFTLLLRFRFHIVAIKADIGKMYRQFSIDEAEADYQRIVYRESPEDPIQDYKLLTVTYGTASASFLATRCVKQLAKDEKQDFPLAAPVLANDLYVDDLISGESNTTNSIQLVKQLNGLVERGGMQLLKYSSSDPAVLESIPAEQREKEKSISLDTDAAIKALGVKWNPDPDSFVFSVIQPKPQPKITKRIVLSELARVFDPLGWLTPTTVAAKIIFQDLWRLTAGWDDPLPDDIQQQWERYQANIIFIKNISIPRCVVRPNLVSMQLHGFCDASEKAYAAAVYLRCVLEDSTVIIHLLTSKSKVAPIKQVSIPRLELCGAVMLARLLTAVKTSAKINPQVFAWTDSTTVLRWFASYPGRWKTFVANRVAEVQELVPVESWNHVIGAENPADCASRGIPAADLCNFALWWTGPDWLKSSSFPTHPHDYNKELVEEEEKKIILVSCQVCVEKTLISKFSALQKLKRVTAYSLRFISNSRKKKEDRQFGELTCEEIEMGLMHWISHVQALEFRYEIKALRKSSELPAASKIRQLCPYLDLRGILRVGGRLQNANGPEERKHPIILPHNHQLTILIIRHFHLESLHGGFQLLWSNLQREFWILRARDTIRHQVRKCVICRRRRAETTQQLMGSLPKARVNPGRAFLHCGVDFAGPYNIRPFKGRGNKTHKSYFAIFVCLGTKAVHLEVVCELTTEAFLASFKRFAARRGVSSHMYSDCGTNFTGADKELQDLLQSANHNAVVSHYLADKGTTWAFNPPSAPHQGGLWEAGVKSTKFHLRRVVGTTTLTLEEFQTVLCQVEAVLNSRPLCAMSSDPADFTALTPGHFLIGEPLTAVPEPDLTSIKVNRLSHWQQAQQLVQHFWRRWSAEYVTSLQQRFKWTSKRENLEIGDLVLVKDDNLPPMKWRLGRIVQLHPGSDALVRVVTVLTDTGEMKRPIVKLSPVLFNSE